MKKTLSLVLALLMMLSIVPMASAEEALPEVVVYMMGDKPADCDMVMEKVNEVLYESKLIGYPNPFKNKVRTFCQNPGGFVSQENYDNNLAVVNGHSYKEKKSDNTTQYHRKKLQLKSVEEI